MRVRSARNVALLGPLLAVALAHCSETGSSTSAPREPRSSGTGRGALTLRFVNRTQQDLYVDTTYDIPLTIEGETGPVKRRRFCVALCGDDCQCNTCGSPMSTTRRISAGEAFDVEWRGEDYENDKCSQADTLCNCDRQITAEAGTYTVSMRGSTGVSPADAPAHDLADPGLLNGASPTGSVCVARAKVVLSDAPSTFEIPFRCEPQP